MPDRPDTTLDALIAKLEAATEPDRSLFEEAYEAAWGRPCWDDGERGERFQRFLDAEAWTDAALSLVPEGCGWAVDAGIYGASWCDVETTDGDYVTGTYDCPGAATPALALVIAALKARRAAC